MLSFFAGKWETCPWRLARAWQCRCSIAESGPEQLKQSGKSDEVQSNLVTRCAVWCRRNLLRSRHHLAFAHDSVTHRSWQIKQIT